MFKLASKSRQRKCIVFKKSVGVFHAEGPTWWNVRPPYVDSLTCGTSSWPWPAYCRCQWPSMFETGLQSSGRYPEPCCADTCTLGCTAWTRSPQRLRACVECRAGTVCACVCPSLHLFICVWLITSCIQNISKSYEQILTKFRGEVGHGPGKNWLDSGGGPVSFVDPGSFSRILYHLQMGAVTFCSISQVLRLGTDFDKIFWRGGAWHKEQSVKFRWWCGTRSRIPEFGSRSGHRNFLVSSAINLSVVYILSYQGGHCFCRNKVKDYSKTFKNSRPFPNLFYGSLQHVTQL